MSELSDGIARIGIRVNESLGRPAVAGLYLPQPVADETFRDEFGFVFLEDGSVGPFYVSMGGILADLWHRHPEPAACRADVHALLQGFGQDTLADRALALGAFNALSASLFRRAGFEPPDRAPVSGLDGLAPGGTVGMVGYFCPLIDRLLERGCQVLVLELSPERLAQRPGLRSTEDPRDLRDCASTLVNDTLDGLLATLSGHVAVELVGPSGSGLPDALFERGVVSVGGTRFADRAALVASLDRGESWGAAGRKYQLVAAGYPGVDALLGAAH